MRKAAVVFIFVTVVVDILAMGIVIPVLPKLIERFEGGDTARAAETFGLFGTAWSLMQFLFMPLIGALSDRFGRRPVILISCFGLGLDFFVMALAPTVGWLLVGRIISGITASSFATAFAYIADVVPPEKRAASFGLVGAAFGLGFTIGPALGGILGLVDPRLPFWAAGALAIANAAYGFFVLPESLPPEKRGEEGEPGRIARAAALASGAFGSRRDGIPDAARARGAAERRGAVHGSSLRLERAARRARARLRRRVRDGRAGRAHQARGRADRRAPRDGHRARLRRGGFRALRPRPVGMALPRGRAGDGAVGFANPSVQALMSRRVAPSEQGRLQGANASIMAIAGLLGPGLFTQVFARLIDPAPGSPFLLAAAMLLVACALGWAATRPR